MNEGKTVPFPSGDFRNLVKMHSIYLKVNSGDAKVFSNDIETEKKTADEKSLGGFPTGKLERFKQGIFIKCS